MESNSSREENDSFVAPIITDELKRDLIEYVMQSYRILLAEQISTWFDFFHTTSTFEKYHDFTPKDVCDIFLNKVLPEIYSFELSEDQKMKLKLLRDHNAFVATETGFQVAPLDERYFVDSRLKDSKYIRHVKNPELKSLPPNPQESILDKEDVPQILVVPEYIKFKTTRETLSAETRALLSAVYGTELELSNCTALSDDEIRQRFRKAKSDFENKGIHRKERFNAELLVENVRTMEMMKYGIVKIAQDHAFAGPNENAHNREETREF